MSEAEEKKKIRDRKRYQENKQRILNSRKDSYYKKTKTEAGRQYFRLKNSKRDKEELKEYYSKWREDNKEKTKKYYQESKQKHKTRSETRSSKPIEKIECGVCYSKERLEYHHFDYSDSVNVAVLCKPCHGKVHRKKDILELVV